MIFKVIKASDRSINKDVEINNLDELKTLQEKYVNPKDISTWGKPSIIVDFNDMTITIYDNYIE